MAKIGGMTTDLGMTSTQYATCVSVLFAGYVSLQVPSNMIASRLSRPGSYICFMCGLWGAVSACTGAVKSYAGLAVCRTVLGFTEAAFFVGALYLLSTFYTKAQLALRTSILYSGLQLGNAFGGLFALAVFNLDGAHHIAGWRWLFIVEGALTVGAAFVFAGFIPNTPKTIRWLTPLEGDQLVYRLAEDFGSYHEPGPFWPSVRLALTDVKMWLLLLCMLLNAITSAATNFFALIIDSLGFNRSTTLPLTVPPYILCMAVILAYSWHSDKKQERALQIAIPYAIVIAANIIAMATTNTAARYFAMMLMPSAFYAPAVIVYSWMSTSITGTSTKRATAMALINASANTPSIWTSYLYSGHEPHYYAAFSVNIAASLLALVFAVATGQYLKKLNSRLDKGEDLGPQGPTEVQKRAGFRFVA